MLAILIWLAIGLPVVGGLVVAFVGDSREKLQHVVAVGFSAAAAVAALAILPQAGADAAVSVSFGPMFGDLTFVPDGLGAFLAAVATVVGCLAVVFSVDYMAGEAELGRFYSLVLYFFGAMAGLALTSNLFLMFVFWEITALCSYALISFYNDDPKAVAGGIKALIITQFGGVGLLALALAAYAQTGVLNPTFGRAEHSSSSFERNGVWALLAAAPSRHSSFTRGCRTQWKRRRRSALIMPPPW